MRTKLLLLIAIVMLTLSLIANISDINRPETKNDLPQPFWPKYTLSGYNVNLFWGEPFIWGFERNPQNSADPEVLGYNIYRTTLDENLQPIDELEKLNSELLTDFSYQDTQSETNIIYQYGFTAVYEEGESDLKLLNVIIKTLTLPYDSDFNVDIRFNDWEEPYLPTWFDMSGNLLEDNSILQPGSGYTWEVRAFLDMAPITPYAIRYREWYYAKETFVWIVSPTILLSSGLHILEAEVAIVKLPWETELKISPDAKIAIMLSFDNGETWSKSDILKEWIGDEFEELNIENLKNVNDTNEIKGVTFSIPIPAINTEKNARVAIYIEQLTGKTTYDFWFKNIKINTELSTADNTVPTLPIKLHQNYPNPFNPTTTILFGIDNSEFITGKSMSCDESQGLANHHIHIDIFNIKGQKIRTLVNGIYPTGKHSVMWNGQDDSGDSVPSGIYFYRLTMNNLSETKKMVLIK